VDRLNAFREEIDKALMGYLPEQEPADLYEAVRYLPLAGGKRLRPIMAMLACTAVGGAHTQAIPFGAALEIIHTFTLAHDDIMDRDELRRGRPAVHTKFGEETAILAGDTLFAKAFEIVSTCGLSPEVITLLTRNIAQMSREICEGQQMDMRFEHEANVTEELFLTMIEKKTARLFEHACFGGAIIGGGSVAEQEALRTYGRNVGMAFQLWDDCLDLVGTGIGKPLGSDICEGKKTLVFIYALAHAATDEWQALHGNRDATPAQVHQVVEVFTGCGALDYATDKAHQYADTARQALDGLPDTEAKHTLLELATFAVTRGT
jgi:geranylgeranyl diphosphate synthase type I